jgi:hypothetical protein
VTDVAEAGCAKKNAERCTGPGKLVGDSGIDAEIEVDVVGSTPLTVGAAMAAGEVAGDPGRHWVVGSAARDSQRPGPRQSGGIVEKTRREVFVVSPADARPRAGREWMRCTAGEHAGDGREQGGSSSSKNGESCHVMHAGGARRGYAPQQSHQSLLVAPSQEVKKLRHCGSGKSAGGVPELQRGQRACVATDSVRCAKEASEAGER